MATRDERALPHDPDLEVDEDAAGTPLPVHLTPHLVALVFVGGSAGTLTRALLDHWFPAGSGFPVTIFAINVTGALALAVLIETLALRGPDAGLRRGLRLLLGTGVLGGYTTYSAFAVQTDALVRAGSIATALAYALTTVAVGFFASIVGIVVTRKVLGP
ncbi:MAG: fluoride efflux transporter FluC [Aeromicrobium sp.]